ncbi:MAG TPA: alpha/beta hydrolase fold domain-containing protein [Acidimicrobiales bacterium]|nr:alpha/beta hydrolase fold domain-containing protein [Acidimicrobiales bacterium]
MPYAFLAVTALGAAAVALAYRPIRREPFTIVSFAAAWIAGELAFQNIVWQMAATGAFIAFGALDGWAGWLGLALAIAGWVGLVGLGVAGLRAADVTAAALDEVRSDALPVPAEPTPPTWGRWWRVTRAIPMKSRAVQTTSNIDYWGDAQRRHRLDVYRSRLAPPQKAPVMVYVHGGAWVIGDKREQGKPMMFELVARGWVCVAINYRLSPKGTWPDHIVDVKKALAWVKEHISEYGGDPAFVAISGGSAGGHLCALAALSAGDPAFQPGFEDADTAVQACVPFYGVMDLTSSPEGSAIFGPGLLEMLEKTVMKVKEADHPEVFRAASPTYRVQAGAPPFFVLQGKNDTLVPVETARTFVERLRGVSRSPVAYAELPLAQHAFDVLASLRCQATTSAVGDFLEGARAAHAAGRTTAMDVTSMRNLSDIESPPGI